jgi:hypothetical protein
VTAPTTVTGGWLQAAADRLRAARAEHPGALAVDPKVIDALAAWLEADARIAELDDDPSLFEEGIAVADAVLLWEVR